MLTTRDYACELPSSVHFISQSWMPSGYDAPMKQCSPIDRWRTLAKLFTRPVMTAMARTGSADLLVRGLRRVGVNVDSQYRSVGAVFDACFKELSDGYRCEYIYKAAIADRIVFGRHSPRTASMQLELPVGRSIVDVAVFNGTSTAYEIKTELDSDKRLVSQSPDYLKAFDRVYVVTHPSLAERYIRSVDHRVGILTLSRRNQLSEVRPPASDLSRVSSATIFRMLRRGEYMEAITHYFGRQPQLPNGAVFAHYERLFGMLSAAQAHEAFVSALRRRSTDGETASYISALPKSLRALGFATPLSGVQRAKLLNAVA
jgi:hypothetical protein